MRLFVFGDSFASQTEGSWVEQLADSMMAFQVINFATNGASEYRIARSIVQYLPTISIRDRVVVCHTYPGRLFIPDHVRHPTRRLKSHPFCDLVTSDSLTKGWRWARITRLYERFLRDEKQDLFQHRLMIEEASRLLGDRAIHTSGFPIDHPMVFDFHTIFLQNRGSINHLDEEGNRIVATTLSEMFSRCAI